jgi:hypothetical protein
MEHFLFIWATLFQLLIKFNVWMTQFSLLFSVIDNGGHCKQNIAGQHHLHETIHQ